MSDAAQTESPPPWLDEALVFCLAKIRRNLRTLKGFPERTERGRWIEMAPELHGWWVGGHWVGLLWLARELTGDPFFEDGARAWGERLLPQLTERADHDLGFLFELGFLLGARITGDAGLQAPALRAADLLARRFNPRGRYIQAWGPLDGAPLERGRTIIDTMMNLDLLYAASRETGDERYASIATAHATTALQRHVRPDGGTSHLCAFDAATGAFLKQDTHQGLSAVSCWSRGQAWAVYGFADCHRATGNAAFLDASRKLADYAWRRAPDDLVPYWDYDSPDIPDDVRDTSAASILAAGLLNLAATEADAVAAETARTRAVAILASLWRNYARPAPDEDCLLPHGTRSKPHGYSDSGLIYGDYYFLEALTRLSRPDFAP